MPGTFKDLVAWQLSVDLCKKIYQVTQGFPPEEKFGLTSQLRRSAISVPSNIAEGAARYSNKEFANFLYIARGSLAELQTQITISKSLGFLDERNGELDESIERIHSVIHGLIRKAKS